MPETLTAFELGHEIESFRQMRARRYRLARAIDDLRETLTALDEDLADAEADLAVMLWNTGPCTIDGREYRHSERDGCDIVEVRPKGLGRRNEPDIVP